MDELTSIVTSTLEARGVLNKIRAELRANVFSAIQEQQGAPDSASNPALESLQRTGHGQVAAKLIHELLLSCSLDYSLAVLLPEAGMTDKELPDRQALAGSLGLDAAGEEPLLAQLVRMHLKGGGAQQPAAVAAASASSPANASSPSGKSPARERVGAHSTLRDLPSLSKPGHGGGLLGDLPSLGGRGAPAGGGGSPGGEQQDEEERRLDAIESKLAGLAGMPSSCSPLAAAAPSRLASGPKPSLAPVSTGSAAAADLEEEIEEIEEIEDDFEDDVDSNSEAAHSFGSANPPAPLMAGGVGSLNSSLGRGIDRSMDESMSPTRLQHELQARPPPRPARHTHALSCCLALLCCPAARRLAPQQRRACKLGRASTTRRASSRRAPPRLVPRGVPRGSPGCDLDARPRVDGCGELSSPAHRRRRRPTRRRGHHGVQGGGGVSKARRGRGARTSAEVFWDQTCRVMGL